MQTIARIGLVFPADVPESLYAQLADAYPEGDTVNAIGVRSFSLKLPLLDARTQRALSVFEVAGFTPWAGFNEPGRTEFQLGLRRTYDRSDLDIAEFLSPYFDKPYRGKGPLTGSWAGRLRAVGELASDIEKAFPEAKASPHDNSGDIESDVTFPRMSPRMAFYLASGGGLEVDGDDPRPYVVREGREPLDILYDLPELHYRRQDLAETPPFDIALTHEAFGPGNRRTVVSQRFRQFCLQRKLSIDFIPVRIDDE